MLKQGCVESLKLRNLTSMNIAKMQECVFENYSLQFLSFDSNTPYQSIINRNKYLAKQQRFKKVKLATPT